MSQKYTGGFITKSPVAPTTSAASGIWTLDQQQQAQKAGTWPSPPIFIEDLFSTYLYTDTGSTQTIVNGIDLASKGGMVWAKCRSAVDDHIEWDSARGTSNYLIPNKTNAQATYAATFNSNGVSIPSLLTGGTYTSWTFAKQPKFFDVVTYTGAGDGTTVSHNLGSTPGCVIVKATSGVDGWFVYHRSLTATATNRYLRLDTTASEAFLGTWISVSDTTITFPAAYGPTASGGTSYVAYLFAHDAGGFPVSGGGSTNGISCGTYTGTGSPLNVTLGYEPQWVLVKKTSATGDWILMDTMRGMSMTTSQWLYPNAATIEDASGTQLNPTATGFTVTSSGSGLNGGGQTYIYIAIRRGPMKTPTVGTSVFSPQAISQADNIDSTGVPFPPDLVNTFSRNGTDRFQSNVFNFVDRLRGLGTPNNTYTASGQALTSSSTGAEFSAAAYVQLKADSQNITRGSGWNSASYGNWINYFWRRAPSFFDEVCYTGTGSATTQTHNLGVVPEFMIVKGRSAGTAGSNWSCYHSALGNTQVISLNEDIQAYTASQWNNTTPTASVFSVGTQTNVNGSGQTYVAYLFATVAGVSKVGSYTGTGAAQTINCGFTAGSRFVMIKRTDEVASGNPWYVWDSARGIIPANDPYLLINSTAAEVTGTDYVDTTNVGFDVTSTAPASINANGGTYIFLAIA